MKKKIGDRVIAVCGTIVVGFIHGPPSGRGKNDLIAVDCIDGIIRNVHPSFIRPYKENFRCNSY